MNIPSNRVAPVTPILKIGAVVLRLDSARSVSEPLAARGQQRSCVGDKESPSTKILIVRPIPKHAGEVPPFVLPRGSRQYQDSAGAWHDARDAATGAAHVATLEPFIRALAREVEEEAGVSGAMLARARVVELGAMEFQSRSKGVYPIHWFVVVPNAADAALLDKQTPADATAVRWASLDAIKTMAACGEFSAGYLPVIETAIARADGAV